MSKVYFVGAGPGDPELITVKGRKLLTEAGVVIYAGSLINTALLKGLDAELHDSARLTLEETTALIEKAIAEGKMVVRLHTGDLSLFSAITEQIEKLNTLNIPWEIIPGVSSAAAGAASIGQELTIPEVSQTVIFTRAAGRTPVPPAEALGALAKHRATLVVFLSIGLIDKVRDELLQGYGPDTPVVIVERASWPQERVVRGVLKDLASLVTEAGIKKTALIYVGEALLASERALGRKSRLYQQGFSHGYRP